MCARAHLMRNNMKKNLEKIFTLASVVVAIILIMVLIVTAFGGIKTEEFDNGLVKGLLFTLAVLYIVLSIVAVVLIFINNDVVKDVTLRTDKGGSIKVSANVITKYVKSACAQVEGVKCKKVTLVSDEYGVRLKTDIKVVDKDVIEVETYLRTLLEDLFYNEFNFRFSSIEFKVTALVPKYEANKEEIEEQVAKKLEELKKDETPDLGEEAAAEEPAEEPAVEEIGKSEEAISEEVANEEAVDATELLEEQVEEPAAEVDEIVDVEVPTEEKSEE